MRSWQQLLAELVPPAQPSLTALEMRRCILQPAAMLAGAAESGRLAQLRSLELQECRCNDWPTVLAALLHDCTALQDLAVTDCMYSASSPPACVLAHTGLTKLNLSGNNFSTLPGGAALAGAQFRKMRQLRQLQGQCIIRRPRCSCQWARHLLAMCRSTTGHTSN